MGAGLSPPLPPHARPADVPARWRGLAEAPSPARGPDWGVLTAADIFYGPHQVDTAGDIDVTPQALAALRRDWQPKEPMLINLLLPYGTLAVWGPVDLALFGPDAAALRGGADGASQVAMLDHDYTGIGAACATFAAHFPRRLPNTVAQDGSTVTVHLQLKILPEPGAFEDFPVTLNASLPVHEGTHTLVSVNSAPNSTWSLYVAKAAQTLTEQGDTAPNLSNFRGTLQALLGREVQKVDLARSGDADLAVLRGPWSRAAQLQPSVHFDAWMQRLADQGYGGLVFRDGNRLAELPAYRNETGAVHYRDGNVSAVFAGVGVRVQAAGLDVVLIGRQPYGVVGVDSAEASPERRAPRPIGLTLVSGTGFNFDPSEAAAWRADRPKQFDTATKVPGSFSLPVVWAKRLVDGGFFA